MAFAIGLRSKGGCPLFRRMTGKVFPGFTDTSKRLIMSQEVHHGNAKKIRFGVSAGNCTGVVFTLYVSSNVFIECS